MSKGYLTPTGEEKIKLNQVYLRQRTLEELLDMLPLSVEWDGEEISFGLTKLVKGYCCSAYETTEGNPVYMDDARNDILEFESTNPCYAVSMMIGWLKTKKLIPSTIASNTADNGKGEGNWISVERELPENGDNILIIQHGKTEATIARFFDEDGITRFERYDNSTEFDKMINYYYDEVTHWQPLPEPPKV